MVLTSEFHFLFLSNFIHSRLLPFFLLMTSLDEGTELTWGWGIVPSGIVRVRRSMGREGRITGRAAGPLGCFETVSCHRGSLGQRQGGKEGQMYRVTVTENAVRSINSRIVPYTSRRSITERLGNEFR
jgi:hypothetical protein